MLLGLLTGCTFLGRAITFDVNREITGESWYRPLETVRGGAEPLPRTPVDPSSAESAAIETVATYTAERQTSALVVVHHGAIEFERHWARDGTATEGPTADRTNSMSMGKTLTAMMVGLAIEDGAIRSVDDLAVNWLPEWQEDARRSITIRQLLQMAAGLPEDTGTEIPPSAMIRMFLTGNLTFQALHEKLDHPPGERFAYSSIAPQSLGIVVERATHRRWSEYVSDRLWRHVGHHDAAVWIDHRGGTAHTFCCFFATADDYAALGQMLLNRGRLHDAQVLPETWVSAMTTPSPLDPDYGYQTWLAYDGPESTRRKERHEDFIPRDCFWLDGRDQERVFVVPSRDLVIVRVGEDTDHDPKGDSGVGNWDDAWVVNTIVRGVDAEGSATLRPARDSPQ